MDHIRDDDHAYNSRDRCDQDVDLWIEITHESHGPKNRNDRIDPGDNSGPNPPKEKEDDKQE